MEELWLRFSHHFVARLDGPLHFRFIVQPLVSILFALRDGTRDARRGDPPYLWSVFAHPERRHALLRDGWKSVGKVFGVAIALDVIYQIVALPAFYPLEALLSGAVLALVPYLLFRGPVNRIALHWLRAPQTWHAGQKPF